MAGLSCWWRLACWEVAYYLGIHEGPLARKFYIGVALAIYLVWLLTDYHAQERGRGSKLTNGGQKVGTGRVAALVFAACLVGGYILGGHLLHWRPAVPCHLLTGAVGNGWHIDFSGERGRRITGAFRAVCATE